MRRKPIRQFFVGPMDDVLASMEHLIAKKPNPRVLIAVLLSVAVTWWIYVPIHELLHVAGCVWTGGTVTELQIAPQYGAALLHKVFPFVTSGGDYAGRLSGFDTKGNDWIYLATDFLPFALSVFIGVPLVMLCTRRRRPILFGSAIVVGFAPFYNVIGDYYEMGSIIVTRAVTVFSGGGDTVAFASMRSDDIFLLLSKLFTESGELGIQGAAEWLGSAFIFVVSFTMAVLLAFATYAAGRAFSRLVVAQGRPTTGTSNPADAANERA